jgi:probable FeS assembly SUF system protein SufT
MSYEQVVVSRDCEAIQIPHGHAVTIPEGTLAIVTQALGGTYTLQVPSMGGLFRVADKDADALGKERRDPAAGAAAAADAGGPVSEEAVWEQLRNVYDPEIPVNIVDLGLVYDLQIQSLGADGSRVDVKMTLTAQGCGMGPSIAMDAQRRIEGLPGVAEAQVDVVWDPPWNPNMISPEGRAKLGMA